MASHAGGSLAGSLYLGVLSGTSLLWLQPLAMLLGIVIQLAIARFMPNAKLGPRLVLATVLGVALWAINFYGILSWLQPMLFGGNWIVDPQLLPPWVAILTHLVFAWTMALLYPWGAYVPYRPQTEVA